jgi:hypothetical protein
MVITSYKYYQSISDTPLKNFIDVAVNNNIYALIISGKPTDTELLNAWSNIYTEYTDNIGNGEHKLYTSVFSEVMYLTAKYKNILVLIEALQNSNKFRIFHTEAYQTLNKLVGSNFPFSAQDCDANEEYLKKCLNRSKGLKIRLDLQGVKLDSLKEKSTGEPVTKKYFTSILNTLSQFAGFHIDDNITVESYCDWVQRFNSYCEKLKHSK